MNRLQAMLQREQPEMITMTTSGNRKNADRVSQQVAEYLSSGGTIKTIPPGVSGFGDFAAKRTQEQVRDSVRQAEYRRGAQS